MPFIIGVLALVFGTFIFIFAMWRRNKRRKLTGINGFTCPDRMVNTKSIEKLLQFLAVVLFISGFMLITFEALRIEDKVANEITTG